MILITISLHFLTHKTMAKRYVDASPDEKHVILSESLSNFTLKDRNDFNLQYKSPYNVFANTPVNASISELLAVWDEVRTLLY
jgi:hypothetical protein